jgi:hypothetical protein
LLYPLSYEGGARLDPRKDRRGCPVWQGVGWDGSLGWIQAVTVSCEMAGAVEVPWLVSPRPNTRADRAQAPEVNCHGRADTDPDWTS